MSCRSIASGRSPASMPRPCRRPNRLNSTASAGVPRRTWANSWTCWSRRCRRRREQNVITGGTASRTNPMSRMISFGARHACTRSIQAPVRSTSAAKTSSLVDHSVSKCHISRVEAAFRSRPRRSTMVRIIGSSESRSASFTSSHPASRPSTDWRNSPPDRMPDVLAASRLGQDRSGHAGQPQRLIQFAIGEQAGFRGDLAAVEFQLEATVEIDPKRVPFRFTHRVSHDRAPQHRRKILIFISESASKIGNIIIYLGHPGS